MMSSFLPKWKESFPLGTKPSCCQEPPDSAPKFHFHLRALGSIWLSPDEVSSWAKIAPIYLRGSLTHFLELCCGLAGLSGRFFFFFLFLMFCFWLIPKCDSTGLSTKVAVVVAESSTQETKRHTWRVGELRLIMLAGPEELTLQALSPEQRGYRVFDTQPSMIKLVCRFAGARAIAKSRTGVSEISSSS